MALRHAPRTLTGLVAGPERAAGPGIAVVQCAFRVVQRAVDPGEEVVAVGHALSILVRDIHNTGGQLLNAVAP